MSAMPLGPTVDVDDGIYGSAFFSIVPAALVVRYLLESAMDALMI